MKKFLFLVTAAILVSCVNLFATDNLPSATTQAPEVCQYSLSKYQGIINNAGTTDYFTVGLSCPSDKDTYATVVVFIDGEHAASEVVKVPAGKTKSQSVYINVGNEHIGERYKLVVQ